MKAKRFDEALAMAKECITYIPDDAVNKYMLNMFPELKESEDERIRNMLIEFFSKGAKNNSYTSNISDKDIVAWLEKQDSYCTKRDVDDAYLKGVTDTKNEIEKQYEASYQIRKDIATFIFNYKGDIKDRAKWMDYLGIDFSFVEKQGEHKPADKEYTFKAIPRLLGMIPPTDRAKSYCQKLIDSLEQEGYSTDAKIVRDCLKQMNGEKVAMATMDEVSFAWNEGHIVKKSAETQHINKTCKEKVNSLTQEPVSKELEKAAEQDVCEAVNNCSATGIPNDHIPSWVQDAMVNEFINGANWRFAQFEKNRLAACDKQTEEEAKIESDFCMGIIDKEHRQPTFDDAIKYGMRLQKEQMMAKAIDAHCFGFQGDALFSFTLPADNYLVGSEVKVIVIEK